MGKADQCGSKGILVHLQVQAHILVLCEAIAGAPVLVQEGIKLPFRFEFAVPHEQHMLQEVSCTLYAHMCVDEEARLAGCIFL